MKRVKRKNKWSIALLVTAAIFFTGSATAALATNNFADAIVITPSSGGNGGQGNFSVQADTVPDCSSGGHINQTLWVFTNGTYYNSSPPYWVEAGWTHCFPGVGSGYYLYFADNRPSGGYHQSKIANASVGENDNYIIKHTGSALWSVYYDGLDLASSGPNPGPNYSDNQGLASTSTGHQNNVGVTNLQWLDQSNNWHAWGTAGSSAGIARQQAGYYYNQSCGGACGNDGGN